MNKDDGLLLLTAIVKDNIKHKDYKRVTELADTYYKMLTGDGISELLHRVTKRETPEEYEMRQAITNSIIPPTLASTKLPFQKAVRKKPLARKIEWTNENNDKKKTEFEKIIGVYWGDASLEKYLEYAFVDYNYLDPNAFLITEFDEFNPQKEKAKPYPFVATSQQAIMFEVQNNILNYLVVQLPIKYALTGSDVKTEDGSKYTMYLGMDTIVFTEVADAGTDGVFVEIDAKWYLVEFFEPKNTKVPARRFGFKRDAQTQGRTFVSCFHDIIPYLNKTLKIDSELDLSTAMTAFPQRFAYVDRCAATGCHKGYLPNGDMCKVCNGTGKANMHNSTMDVITLDLPHNPEEMIDLERMLVYKAPPIELLTFQKEYIRDLQSMVYLMMFNKELLTRNESVNTATEVNITQDNMNDTLHPFAQGLSSMWEYVVQDIATFTDFGKGLIVEHQYPNDFKFKTLTDLMGELKAAKDASASTSTIAAIEDDINEILYADRPEELKIIRIKNSFNPFRGYSEENVQLLIAQKLTTEFNATLWANLESIFNELEQEHVDPWLYDLAYAKILEFVKAKTLEYIEKMKGEKTPEPQLNLAKPQVNLSGDDTQ